MMSSYEQQAVQELQRWRHQMMRRPTLVNHLSRMAQQRINRVIPPRVHAAITATIKTMVRGVLFGAKYLNKPVTEPRSLEQTEIAVLQRIDWYKRTAAAEGGITGAGGLLLAMADFPILLSLKLKLLFDIASLYGHDVRDYRERVYILHVFQLAFSSQQHRREVFHQMEHWDVKKRHLPDDIHQFAWQPFQQEYRDYIDLAKLAQLIPGIGAVVGLVVNYRLLHKLGRTAMNAYRLRRAEAGEQQGSQ